MSTPTTHPRNGTDPAPHDATHEAHEAHADHADHGGHGDHDHAGHAEVFRRKFWVSLVLTLPAGVYSQMVQDWLGYAAPSFSGDEWVASPG